MSSETRNLILAIALSAAVVLGWEFFYLQPMAEEAARIEALQQEAEAEEGAAPSLPDRALEDAIDDAAIAADVVENGITAQEALTEGPRLSIENRELKGSISLAGARFDDLALLKHETALKSGVPIALLQPAALLNGYYVRFGWQSDGKQADFLPGADTLWKPEGGDLTPDSPLLLSWTNAAGVRFEQAISLDDRFMFTVTQRVVNESDNDFVVSPYGLIHRKGTVTTDGIFILHEGPFGVFDGQLEEENYSDLRDDPVTSTTSVGGWMGITDKYWMTTLVPDYQTPLALARLRVYDAQSGQVTRAEYIEKPRTAAAGATLETTTRFYAGPKIVGAIDDYAEEYNIALFDRTIDWGWLYFLTRPIFYLLHLLFELVGNFGVAIILLTLLVKGALYPLANKGYVSMAHMKKAQPKMKALQERYKDDRQKLSQEMMALYQKEKINPLAGCLPMLLQIPVFFALYKVLYVTIEMRHQPFFGWIQDLSAPDPLTPITLFGLVPWDPPSFLAVGVWPILMGLSMWLQQKANPQPNMDPTQAQILMMLPILFTFILAQFAAGLVIYWTLNSVLSIAQQYYIQQREMKKDAAEEATRKAAKTAGSKSD